MIALSYKKKTLSNFSKAYESMFIKHSQQMHVFLHLLQYLLPVLVYTELSIPATHVEMNKKKLWHPCAFMVKKTP